MEVAELQGRVMASRLHIITTACSVGRAQMDDAISRAVADLEHLEQCWSRFIDTSDVSRINQLGPNGGTIEVDLSTLTLLAAMEQGYAQTAGRFDPTVLGALMAEGYGASRNDPTAVSRVVVQAVRPESLHAVQLDPVAGTVVVPPGLLVDPGGIGKGLAADLTVARLLRDGADGAMVEIGGDLAMAGIAVDPAGWLVDVERADPAEGMLCSLAVSGGGVATSSVRSLRWSIGGEVRHHQIDPRTAACSTTDLSAVTVIAPTGWLAEVHATAALGVGSAEFVPYLEGHGLSGIGVEVTRAGTKLWTTSDLAWVEADLGCVVS